MLQSNLFTKTRKEAPAEEVSTNAKLLIRAGFIHKEMAGVYDYLPLGLRVLRKIEQVIREEMNAIGGQEVLLSTLQNPETWNATNRWDDSIVDNWFKTKLKNDTELGLGFTHEEPIAALLKDHVSSYRDLPFYPYQIQTKFRNETRAKSGIMRGREFLMKDMYSFTATQEETDEFHKMARVAYMNVFKRIGLGDKTYFTYASGGVFSKYSYEFQVVCDSGEDKIWIINESNKEAVNDEIKNEVTPESLEVEGKYDTYSQAVEVGNIFKLGTRFSEALGLTYKDESGTSIPVVMGSYGIGPSRLMGLAVEVLSDEKGIVWPKEIAPFAVHLIEIAPKTGDAVRNETQKLYNELTAKGIEVLFDDREISAGAKFADSDLIGIPYRVVVSEKTLEKQAYELVDRKTGETKFVNTDDLIKLNHV